MAIKNVTALFKAIDNNTVFRSRLNSFNDKGELMHFLETNNMSFSFNEFEDAVNILHTQCQTHEAANDLFAKVNWFKFLFYSLKNSPL